MLLSMYHQLYTRVQLTLACIPRLNHTSLFSASVSVVHTPHKPQVCADIAIQILETKYLTKKKLTKSERA